MFGPEILAALLIGAGALAAGLRLLLLRKGRWGWLLAALSIACGGLLYFTLFPPLLPIGGETLLVATAETPSGARAAAGERLVTLTEAPATADAESVPDLATALRRHAQVRRIRIMGRGLTERDRDIAAGLPVDFTPMPLPKGLIRLDPPADTPAGSVFTLAGEAGGLDAGTAELLDPSGSRVDVRSLAGDGRFTLGGTARTPGLAQFTVRLRGKDKAIVLDTPVPLRTLADRPLRAQLIGAPSPEAKYLRRWAEDSGIELQSRLEAGGGVDLGGGSVRLDSAGLREVDVVIIDDQSVAGMGNGGRGALAQAVAGGLGLVVRITAPITASTRDALRTLGLTVEGGSDVAAVSLPPLAPDAEALAVRRGPGSADVPDSLNTFNDPPPEIARWAVRAGPGFVPVVTDAEGALLTGWQPRGQGRVALWTVADSFALVLNGQAARYEQWWSAALSAVSRPDTQFRPHVPALVEAGERTVICGIAAAARVVGPGSDEVALALDPDAGARSCAAYWPAEPGPHTIVQQSVDGEQSSEFLVLPKDALKTIRATETGDGTALWAVEQSNPAEGTVPARRGPSWPWLFGWLGLSAALWWGERRLRAGTVAGN